MALAANPFGINDKTDKASQDAIYKVIAPLYESKAKDDIVVVLVDDNAITELYEHGITNANEWPLLYEDHATILSRVARYGAKAVFVDVYFKRKRSTDNTFDRFKRRIQHHQEKYKTAFIFAGGYADETFSPLQKELSSIATLSVNGWGDYGDAYPLKDKDQHSVAFDLYSIACLQGSPLASCTEQTLLKQQVKNGDAVSVRWGSQPAKPAFPEFVTGICTAETNSVLSMFQQILKGLVNDIYNYGEPDDGEVRCPYQQVLLADNLMYIDKYGSPEQKTHLGNLLKNKLVFYGVQLEGLHDTIISPAHGALPGVMFHAMALDNLMTYGNRYIKGQSNIVDALSYLAWAMLVLTIAGMLLWMETRTHNFTQTIDTKNSAREHWVTKLHHLAHLRWPINVAGLIVVILFSYVQFAYMRYEPLNSLSFLALTGLISQLVHNDVSGHFYSWAIGMPARLKEAQGLKQSITGIIGRRMKE